MSLFMMKKHGLEKKFGFDFSNVTISTRIKKEDIENFQCPKPPADELNKLAEFSKSVQINKIGPAAFFSSSQNLENKELITSLPIVSFFDFMECWLYDRTRGYYSSGVVKIDNELTKKDFVTNAHKGYAFAFVNLLDMYGQWLSEGEPSVFYNVEAGAGDGILAFKILSLAKKLAHDNSSEPKWDKFYKSLQYIILEISPALSEKQSNRCREFIEENKITIITANATEYKFSHPIHRFFANELVDAFPLYGYKLNEKNDILTHAKIQLISKHELDLYYLKKIPSGIYASHENYKTELNKIADEFSLPDGYYIVHRELLTKIQDTLGINCKYFDLAIPIAYFETSKLCLEENSHMLNYLKKTDYIYINPNIKLLAINLFLNQSHSVVLYDYGGIPDEISTSIRFFGNKEKTKKTYDITHDVDFYSVKKSIF